MNENPKLIINVTKEFRDLIHSFQKAIQHIEYEKEASNRLEYMPLPEDPRRRNTLNRADKDLIKIKQSI